MKAQFATIEALSSLIIAISAVCLSAQMINSSQHSLMLERSNLSSKAAAFDLLDQISSNKSLQQCVSNANSACFDNYSQYYRAIYGINKIGIERSSNQMENYSSVYCGELNNGPICIGVS